MATAKQKAARAKYLKNRKKKLAYMRQYYKANKAKRKAYQKKYAKKVKRQGGPNYLKGKGKGRRPLFPRVTAHNRRNGKFTKGKSGTTKGRKPRSSGLAFGTKKKGTRKRKAA